MEEALKQGEAVGTLIRCALCGDEVDAEIMEYHRGVEEHVLELIRTHNPSWIHADGKCPKAKDYYLSVILGRELAE